MREMRETLPDTLDLIVVCVEAGMGVDAALNRVGKEQNSQGLALGEELVLATQEMQAGANRKEALIRLADRVVIAGDIADGGIVRVRTAQSEKHMLQRSRGQIDQFLRLVDDMLL